MDEIFISYASADRTKAQVLAEALGEREWDVWWDREIPLGQSFDEVIEKSIARAKCVIVLWSQISVASEWVRNEASEGKRRGILIPAFIEHVDAPLAFRLLNGADLTDWLDGGSPAEFDRLVQGIAELLGQTPKTSAAPELQSISDQRTARTDLARTKRWRTPLIVTALVLVAVGAGLTGYWLKGPEREISKREEIPPPKVPDDLGIAQAQKGFNDLIGMLGGAVPATSMAKGFHVPDLGVRIAYLTQQQSASTLGAMPAGAVVMEVESGRPMARAGLHVGDVVLAIGGRKIGSEDDLRQAIFKIGPGKTTYSYRRGDDTKTVSVDCSNCKAE
jgi:TIR domain-containing protein/PDZ domain-containing protein